jgi:hypothetical protein
MLGWLAAYKYVTPTHQVRMALCEFMWEINQKITNSSCHPLSRWVRILLLPRVRIQRLTVKPYLLTSVVFWGDKTLGKWESRLKVKVHTSAELKLIYQPCSQTRAAQILTRWEMDSHGLWRWKLGWGCYLVLWRDGSPVFFGVATPCHFWRLLPL